MQGGSLLLDEQLGDRVVVLDDLPEVEHAVALVEEGPPHHVPRFERLYYSNDVAYSVEYDE